ncbi:MAG: hypothetical protein ACYS72_01690, partial [Planctomycetota bacterium]
MKKRIALLSGLLLVSIVGQLLLRPCLGNETKDGEQIFSSEQDNTSELMGTKDLFEAEQEEEDFKSGDLQSDL